LGALRDALLQMRGAVVEASAKVGVRPLAVGTCPNPPPVVDVPRYHRMVREFGVPLAAIPGDMPMVTALLDRLATRGSGAARQRRVFAERGDLAEVMAFLAAEVCRDDRQPRPAATIEL
jgi:carboxylate-amine ligase